jgi:hypothetical protein
MIYSLYQVVDSYYVHIPKNKRYTLWNQCESSALKLLKISITAGHYSGLKQVEILKALSVELDLLKVFFRLSRETRCIDSKQYLEIQTIVSEIGRMLGGWIKSASSQAQKK